MGKRGRPSPGDLNVVSLPVDGMRAKLQPPDHLNAKERKLFSEIIANAPSTQFSSSDVYLLATFAVVTNQIRDIAKEASKGDEETRRMKFKSLCEAVKV